MSKLFFIILITFTMLNSKELFKNIDEAEFILKEAQLAVVRASANQLTKQKAINTLKGLNIASIKNDTNRSLKKSLIALFKKYHKARGLETSYAVACIKYGKMYNIDPTILASIIVKESSGNHRLIHSTVRVLVYDKATKTYHRVKTNAIGLGGIIWEIHKDLLISNGIRTKESLFDPWTNIKAIAVILSHYSKLKRVKSANTSLESALYRYYGVVAGGTSAKQYLALIYNIKHRID